MTRNAFIRNTGRSLMLVLILAAGGFLVATRRISLRNDCAAGSNCAGCRLEKLCRPPEEKKMEQDEKK